MRAAYAALAALACVAHRPGAVAQLVIPSVTDTGVCDWASLADKITALNSVCCFDDRGAGSECNGVRCTVDCAGHILPLLERCRAVIDLLFDGVDQIYDGVASSFDSIYESCVGIGAPTALAALAEMQAAGMCTGDELNGVGETAVGEAPCEDIRQGCSSLIAAGMTCAADFAPSGMMAGQCERTCAFCDGPAPPPPPCEDVRESCSATIATGFVSCESDFCPSCPMASQCGAPQNAPALKTFGLRLGRQIV